MSYSDKLEYRMRIHDRNLAGTEGAEAARTRETQKTEGTANAGNATVRNHDGDRVEFSNTLGRLSQALNMDHTAHTAKLQALTASYRNGTYRPDAAAVSRGMVSEALSGGQ